MLRFSLDCLCFFSQLNHDCAPSSTATRTSDGVGTSTTRTRPAASLAEFRLLLEKLRRV